MSYQGTTNAKPNPPQLVYGSNIWGNRTTDILTSTRIAGQNIWRYNTTDGSSEMISTTYISDGLYLGMKEGDLILGSLTTGSSVTVYIGVVGQVTTLGCGIASTGGQITSTR